MNLITEQLDENKSTEALFCPCSLIKTIHELIIRISNDDNVVTEKITEYYGSNFLNYFTKPQKSGQIYQEVSNKDLISANAIAICHKDGQLMEAFNNASLYRNQTRKLAGE